MSHAGLVERSFLYEWNSSIKQLFRLPVGSGRACKIYEQHYKQTVDGWNRVPEAAGRESLAITTQSITSSTRHIQPQAPRRCLHNIFPYSHDHALSSYRAVESSVFIVCASDILSSAIFHMLIIYSRSVGYRGTRSARCVITICVTGCQFLCIWTIGNGFIHIDFSAL